MFRNLMMMLIVASTSLYADSSSKIVGTWLTQKAEKNAKIKINACQANPDRLCGKIVWLQEPTYDDGTPKSDKNNENADLQSRPLMGLELLTGFSQSDDETWVDGTIYNPEDGATYSCTIDYTEEDGKQYLDVRGFVGISLLGKTQRWVRAD